MVAAPLGGVLVGAWGLPAIAWGDAVTFGISLCVLVAVRELAGPAPERAAADGAARPRLDLADGLRVVVRTPGLLRALLLTGAAGAFIPPVAPLLVPLAGRAAGWGPRSTGAVAGAVGVGVIAAALLVARRRTGRVGRATVTTGLALSATGAAVLAAGTALGSVALAVVGGLIFGFGNGIFVARLAPFVLGSAPRTHLARVQALVGLVQLVPVMVTNNALGALAEHTSPGWAVATTATGLAACAVFARRQATPSA